MSSESIGVVLAKTVREEAEKSQKPHLTLFNPFTKLVEKICVVSRVPNVPEQVQKKRDRIRFAFISMPAFKFEWRMRSSIPDPPAADTDSCRRHLVEFTEPDEMLRVFRDTLSIALKDLKADVVCISELGMPSANMEPLLEARELAQTLSREHSALIIAGSVHESKTYHNTGYLFHPGSSKDGTHFYKSISAVSVGRRYGVEHGELISAPPMRRVPMVEMFGLKIASMICLDIADYASLAAVVKCADLVDILLVPCSTLKFDDMSEIAKTASKALPGIVAMVNANIPEATAAPISVWDFGKRRDLPIDEKQVPGAGVSFLDVEYADFQSTRTQWKASARDDMQWLFGRRDGPTVVV